MKSNWRITDLQNAVEIALEAATYDGQSSARIQSVPDTRAIRYYTTLGILDRPSEMKGRTAFYDRRHVLQLVSIKRFQAEGLSLGEIQLKLTGLSNRKLTGIAKLPTGFWETLEEKLIKQAAQEKKASAKAKTKTTKIEVEDRIDAGPSPHTMDLNQTAMAKAALPSEATPVRARSSKKSKTKPTQRSAGAFWAAPVIDADEAQLPQPAADTITVRNETRIEFPSGIAISIPISNEGVTPEFIQQLLPTVQELASKIESIQRRQKSGNRTSSNDQT